MSARALGRPAARALLVLVALCGAAPASAQDARAELVAAYGRIDAALARGALEDALAEAEHAESEALPRFHRGLLRLRAAELQRGLGRWSDSRASLALASELIGESRAALLPRCYLHALLAQVHLDLGLLDVASRELARAQEHLEAAESAGLTGDAERLQVDYVVATLLTSREDYAELEHFVSRALAHPVYGRHPARGALLAARAGLGLSEAARLRPEQAGPARALLERALAEEQLPPVERVLPELALASLALRAGDRVAAEEAVARAGAGLGADPARSSLPQRTSWLALRAQLVLAPADEPASRETLGAWRETLEQASDEALAEWSGRELRPGGYGFLQYADQRSLLSEWIRLVLALEGEERGARIAFERVARTGDASTLARRLRAEGALDEPAAVSVEDTQRHALLLYLPAPDRSHLFVAAERRVVHLFLPGADALESARRACVRALQDAQEPDAPAGASAAWRAATSELGRALLPEAACRALASCPRVTILGRDLLGDVPFEALAFEGTSFGIARALSHWPSLGVGGALRERARREERALRPGAGAALLVAAPRSSGLSLTSAEAEAMLAAYPASARRIAFGPEARPSCLVGLRGVRVLELFTHGRRDPERERPMTFLLDAGEGESAAALGAEEVERLDTPPVVVLAVCRSGGGPKRRGDASAAELASTFFLNERTRCVLASPFDLDARATQRLSIAFHAALVGGAPPDEALQAARAELARDERFADPRFHGLLAALGAADVPLWRP